MRYIVNISLLYLFLFTLVMSSTELGPQLLEDHDVKYLPSEVFSQDPLETYFSRQRHKGGSCDNPTVPDFTTTLQHRCSKRALRQRSYRVPKPPLTVAMLPYLSERGDIHNLYNMYMYMLFDLCKTSYDCVITSILTVGCVRTYVRDGNGSRMRVLPDVL